MATEINVKRTELSFRLLFAIQKCSSEKKKKNSARNVKLLFLEKLNKDDVKRKWKKVGKKTWPLSNLHCHIKYKRYGKTKYTIMMNCNFVHNVPVFTAFAFFLN